MTTRRDVLRLGAWACAGAALPAVPRRRRQARNAADPRRHGLHRARRSRRKPCSAAGRSRTSTAARAPPTAWPDVETLIGDRKGNLDALRGRKCDAVVDDTGYIPKYCKMSAELLAPSVGYCLFISSISAYASFVKPNDEHSATGKLARTRRPRRSRTISYGPMKALCEQYSAAAFKGRCSIVRPGYIVGPGIAATASPTGRCAPRRGGEMLAPGTPHDPIQIIDVRDLAAWMMKLVESRTNGYFNAVSAPGAFTMGDLVQRERAGLTAGRQPRSPGCRRTSSPRTGRPRSWTCRPGRRARASMPAPRSPQPTRRRKTGLRVRPMAQTVHDTLAWFKTLPAERQAKLRAGLDPQKEAETLRLWHADKLSG